MTITKEQIARLSQLAKNCIPTDQPYSDKVINRYVLEASESVLQTEMHPEFVLALLDEVDRLQDVDDKLQAILHHTSGWKIVGTDADLNTMMSFINEFMDRKASARADDEGARVFDAVMNEFGKLHPDYLDQGKFESVLGMRERILGGGDRGQD